MTDWADLQPRFRAAVLSREHSMQAVADEIHVGRRTVYRLMANQVTPRPSVQTVIEQFVDRLCPKARPTADDPAD